MTVKPYTNIPVQKCAIFPDQIVLDNLHLEIHQAYLIYYFVF